MPLGLQSYTINSVSPQTAQITASTLPAVVPIGLIEQIEIVAPDSNRIVLKADDDLYVREKSETCYAADARKA